MIDNRDDTTMLKDKIARFSQVIEDQARKLIARETEDRLRAFREQQTSYGLGVTASVNLVEVWEDPDGQLPPKVVAEVHISGVAQDIKRRLDIPVGAFHDPLKRDHIFELCMLRAEARLALAGRRDGAVLARMNALEEQLGI